MRLRWSWQDIDLRFTLNTGDPVEPREFFDILRRRWLSIVTVTLLTLASVAAMTLMMPKSYTASTQIFLAGSGDSVSALAPASSVVEKQMASYAEVATSPKLLNKVAEQLGLNTTAVELADSIKANVPVGTVITRDRCDRSRSASSCAHCQCRW